MSSPCSSEVWLRKPDQFSDWGGGVICLIKAEKEKGRAREMLRIYALGMMPRASLHPLAKQSPDCRGLIHPSPILGRGRPEQSASFILRLRPLAQCCEGVVGCPGNQVSHDKSSHHWL